MKLEPHRPQLPSLAELLEHPRVKGLVARVNRSTLAHRATGFLDELRHSLAERAGRVEVPSVSQLAERLARRLLGEPPSSGPVINATGLVVGDPRLAPPLADRAIEVMVHLAGDYHADGAELRRAAESLLCELTGAEAALAVGSFEAAVNIVLATAAGHREVLLLGDSAAPAANAWRKLAARHAAVLQISEDLGTTSQNPAVSAILRSPEADGRLAASDVSAVANQRGAVFIDVQPLAGLLDPANYGLPSLETIESRWHAGANLVVCNAAGLLGGPDLGLIIGTQSLVQAARAHYLASLAEADPISAAALHTTLEIYRDDQEGSAAFSIPVWQLLSAPLENLKQRAERIAQLIAATGAVESAEALELRRPWRADRVSITSPTWTVAIRPKGAGADATLKQLRQQAYPIHAVAEDGVIHLDLRSVFPRWDQRLVGAFDADAAG